MPDDEIFPIGKAIKKQPYVFDERQIMKSALQIAISDRIELIYVECCGETLEQRLERLKKEDQEEYQLLVDEIAVVNDMLQMLYRKYGYKHAHPWR
jgi:hypothetical protein